MPEFEGLPDSLQLEDRGEFAILRLDRPHKRNALNEATIRAVERFFTDLPRRVRAVVLGTTGDHFSAGLDLADLTGSDAFEGMLHSRTWHRAFAAIESGPVPVISALRGAVIGGGLELAASTHIRVADASTFYALPEGTRGIYVGGGASVRVPKLIGLPRTQDMMLTGRVYSADDGERIGLSQYVVAEGQAEAKAVELAQQVATLAPATAYAIIQALPSSATADAATGLITESLMSAIAQDAPEAKQRLRAFLDGKAAKVSRD